MTRSPLTQAPRSRTAALRVLAALVGVLALWAAPPAAAQGGVEAYVTYYEYSYHTEVLVVGQYVDHARRPVNGHEVWSWTPDGYLLAAGTEHAFADAVASTMTREDRSLFCASMSCTNGGVVTRHETLAEAVNDRLEVMARFRGEGFDVFIVDFQHPSGDDGYDGPERVEHLARLSEFQYPYYWAGYIEAKMGREEEDDRDDRKGGDRDDEDEEDEVTEFNPASYYALMCENADAHYRAGDKQTALDLYVTLEREGGLYLSAECGAQVRERRGELQMDIGAEATVDLLSAVSEAFGVNAGLALGMVALDREGVGPSSHMVGGFSFGTSVVYVDLLLGDAAMGPLWLGSQTPEPPYYLGCDSWYDTDMAGNYCGDYYPEGSDYDWQVDYAVNVGVVSPLGLPLGEDFGLFPLGYVGGVKTEGDGTLTQFGVGLVFGPSYADRGGLPVFDGAGARGTVAFAPGGVTWSLGMLFDFGD